MLERRKAICLFATTVLVAAGAARADEKAEALLKEVDAKTQMIKTFHAKVVGKGLAFTEPGSRRVPFPHRFSWPRR